MAMEEIFLAIDSLIKKVSNRNPHDELPDDLEETSIRFCEALAEMTAGHKMDPNKHLKFFNTQIDEMVVVDNIDFVSVCEHHLLPFTGVVHVGYIPIGKIIGLSKIPRIVECFAKRLQVQERLVCDIAEFLYESGLNPKGVGVIIKAKHSCMSCRGIKKQNATMTTSALRGVFQTDPSTRAEFLKFAGV